MTKSRNCAEGHGKKNIIILEINMLEDKNVSKYKICNESNPNYKIFNPQAEPF